MVSKKQEEKVPVILEKKNPCEQVLWTRLTWLVKHSQSNSEQVDNEQHIVKQPTTNMDICVEDPIATPREISYKKTNKRSAKPYLKKIY